MTTEHTKQAQPTPYDAEITRPWDDADFPTTLEALKGLYAKGQRSGYLRAKAEDADLLAALEKQFEGEHGQRDHIRSCSRGYIVRRPPNAPVGECEDAYCEAARAAIAKAKGGTP